MRLATLPLLLLLAGCAVDAERIAPTLDVTRDSPVWPEPPAVPRYAFLQELIGERDFVAEDDTGSTLGTVFRWVVGLVVGEPRYLELRRPVSGMVDDRGRICVLDTSLKAVIVFDLSAKEVLRWREAAPNTAFESPVAIVGDGHGGYLVTDSELGEIFRLDGEGGPVGRFGKTIVERPTGIARDDETGRIFVADTARHDIKVFDDGGRLLGTIGGRGTEPGRFNYPLFLAFSQGRLYVADSLNFRVQVFDRDGQFERAFGKIGLFVGNLTRPKGVAVGSDGRVYVVESYYDHLIVFDGAGRLLLPIGGTGKGVGQFYLPAGVWTDANGRVFVADMFNGRIIVLLELDREAAG